MRLLEQDNIRNLPKLSENPLFSWTSIGSSSQDFYRDLTSIFVLCSHHEHACVRLCNMHSCVKQRAFCVPTTKLCTGWLLCRNFSRKVQPASPKLNSFLSQLMVVLPSSSQSIFWCFFHVTTLRQSLKPPHSRRVFKFLIKKSKAWVDPPCLWLARWGKKERSF